MKSLNLLLLFLLTVSAAAQTSSRYPEAPGILVVKHSWSTRVINSKMNEDPLRASQERLDSAAIQSQRDEDYRRAGIVQKPHGQEVMISTTSQPIHALQYIFEAEIRNTGTKKMKLIVWEYVFLESEGGREIGYRSFTSKVSVNPGKSAKLSGYLTRRVDTAAKLKEAHEAAQQSQKKYAEKIVIDRIDYEDNSVWASPVR